MYMYDPANGVQVVQMLSHAILLTVRILQDPSPNGNEKNVNTAWNEKIEYIHIIICII